MMSAWEAGPWRHRPATLMAALNKQKKLIYILRDPINRIESHLLYNASRGRSVGGPKATESFENASSYWSQIQRFDAAGFSDSLLLLDFDDLCSDPVNSVRKVQEFIGLDFEEPTDVRVHNSRRSSGRLLTEAQERKHWENFRPDIEALAASGRFAAAQKWIDTWSAKFG